MRFRKGILRPATPFPSLPSGMDRILKKHFDTFRDKRELPPELKKLEGKVKLFDNARLLDEWRNNFKGIQWEDKNGNILRGAVDNILQKRKKLIILDYKTRGFPLKEDTHKHYQDQMNVYNLLFRRNGYQTEDYSYLLFYYPNKVLKNGNIDFHVDVIEIKINVNAAEKLFKEALKTLGAPKPKSHKDCKFCKWHLLA